MPGQGAQRGENTAVVFIIGAQFDTIAARNRQREFERVDGIEAETGIEQWLFRINFGWPDLELQGLDDKPGKFLL